MFLMENITDNKKMTFAVHTLHHHNSYCLWRLSAAYGTLDLVCVCVCVCVCGFPIFL